MPFRLTYQLLHDPSRRKAWRWTWAVLAAVVGVAALTPGELAPTVTSSDKLDHLLGFAALSGTGLLALAPGRKSTALASVSMLTYGALIELLQTRVAGRSGDWHDVLADAIGVVLGIMIVISARWLSRVQHR